MELIVHVTATAEDLIYRLDPRSKKLLETQLCNITDHVTMASKLHIGFETKGDYEHYFGDFENNQVPILLTGLSPARLKGLGFTELVFFRTMTGASNRVVL